MIQRIQSVYLLIVAGLFIALMFFPLATIQSGNNLYSFNVTGLNTIEQPSELITPMWALMGLAAIIILLSFSIIFLYKKRMLQIRICVFNSFLIVGFCALFGFYLWQLGKSPEFPDMKISFSLWDAFPIISIILNYLAIRNIGADEVLIRSLDRLR